MQGNMLGVGVKAKPRPYTQGVLVVDVIKFVHLYCTKQDMISAIRELKQMRCESD